VFVLVEELDEEDVIVLVTVAVAVAVEVASAVVGNVEVTVVVAGVTVEEV
jgi:hypothetical protein